MHSNHCQINHGTITLIRSIIIRNVRVFSSQIDHIRIDIMFKRAVKVDHVSIWILRVVSPRHTKDEILDHLPATAPNNLTNCPRLATWAAWRPFRRKIQGIVHVVILDVADVDDRNWDLYNSHRVGSWLPDIRDGND
jgi:hypothetical protein